jgi:hypothetical protein
VQVDAKSERKPNVAYALAFGADGTAGDSAFYADHLSAIEARIWHRQDDPYAALLALWLNKYGEGITDIELYRDEYEVVPVGFWIIADDEHMKAVDAVWEAVDPRGDSSTYAANAAAKAVAQALASEVIWTDNGRDRVEYHLQENGWTYGYAKGDDDLLVGNRVLEDTTIRVCASFIENDLVQLSLVGEGPYAGQVEFDLDHSCLFIPAMALTRLEQEASRSEVPEDVTLEALGHMRDMLAALVGKNQVHVAAGFIRDRLEEIPVSWHSEDDYTLLGQLFCMLAQLRNEKPSG